ncbi:hypothetical protein AURDEDRAFT_66571 [Auricularia subglabra TFB-10046 SS5]|nr:hypothetical protein AURDEDRAFT_66571 [Auricularia subglabra TFB-10046 SS5]
MGAEFLLDDAPAAGGFLVDDAPAAGGFLVDDAPAAAGGFINEPPTGGGFIVDDGDAPTHIALERIPGALQALDLSPDDADVLAIFHNAASGWGADAAGSESSGVARKDWRAVCAVLLAGRSEESFPEVPLSGSDEDEDGDGEADGVEDGDEYMDEEDASESELSAVPSDDEDEDYGAAATRGKKGGAGKGKGKKTKAAAAAGASDGPAQLTARQKRESRATFALFFPDVPEERLDAQRIRIKDIMRVSDLLKEKITAEEIIEMLQEFSTAPDKSVGLADFEQVLVLAQLV